MKQKEECAICYKIICRQCGWEASEDEVLLIQKQELTVCPICGWKPEGNEK